MHSLISVSVNHLYVRGNESLSSAEIVTGNAIGMITAINNVSGELVEEEDFVHNSATPSSK